MPVQKLDASALYRPCKPEQFDFQTTDDLDPLAEIVGQPRAVEAVRFGTGIEREGYNIFALGPPGTGKRSLIWQYLERQAPHEGTPNDWCYVYNFDDPSKPKALQLPTGRGKQLQTDMEQLSEKNSADSKTSTGKWPQKWSNRRSQNCAIATKTYPK